MPFPFSTADKRYRLTFIGPEGVFVCEKNADGPNHALERAIRQMEREKVNPEGVRLSEIELIEAGTVPNEHETEGGDG